jgi:hypothetical protein
VFDAPDEGWVYGNADTLEPDHDSGVTFGLVRLLEDLRLDLYDLNRLFGEQDTDAVIGKRT